jgi:hypothetical protein
MYHAAQMADLERPHARDEDPGMMEGCDGALSQLRYAWATRREILHLVRLSIPGRRERK